MGKWVDDKIWDEGGTNFQLQVSHRGEKYSIGNRVDNIIITF